MARRGVDEAGTGIGGDMIAGKQRHFEIIAQTAEGMGAYQRGQFPLLHRADARQHHLGLLGDIFRQQIGQKDFLARARQRTIGGIGDLIKPVGNLR